MVVRATVVAMATYAMSCAGPGNDLTGDGDAGQRRGERSERNGSDPGPAHADKSREPPAPSESVLTLNQIGKQPRCGAAGDGATVAPMTTTTQRNSYPGLALILAGAAWDLIMTTIMFSVVDLPDGLWFLLDAPGMALIALGFARYSRKTLPVAAAFGIFAAMHVIISTNPDGLGFLLGPGDLLIALCGFASTIWIVRTEGWGAKSGGVLAFTASILVIGPLLAIYGDTGLAWGLPLYSLCMLAACSLLRRGSVEGPSADAPPTYTLA